MQLFFGIVGSLALLALALASALAAAFREGHKDRTNGFCLTRMEIVKLTEAQAWEAGMRPAWETKT